ncbi:hypothetical protein GO730_00750 [Spirosoma sp. HMF3257]|uniref:Pepco domain-containing protein n=1 Tax=Spirosoma telluris TaxID=2183553 RepID=A0A327NL76_9BACT|nr:hypothetical protein [Spirosoma telluris]RAI73328.1 hypothetical protein HMF3257_00730 [Spirosoma telluris]
MSNWIPIITAKRTITSLEQDRGHDEKQGVIPNLVNSVVNNIDADHFIDQVEGIATKVQAIAERMKGRVSEFEVDEITISLAISADGSIGIATVGAEASIEISFKRNK